MNGQSGYIAVFDVGKTNKKLLIYDRELNLADSVYAQFDEVAQGGEFHELLGETAAWFLNALADMASRYAIEAVSVSAHGSWRLLRSRQTEVGFRSSLLHQYPFRFFCYAKLTARISARIDIRKLAVEFHALD